MLEAKIYNNLNGDFKKSNIEFTNEEAFYIISSALATELKAVEENINFVTNDNVRKMYQKKFDKIVEMLELLNKPITKRTR